MVQVFNMKLSLFKIYNVDISNQKKIDKYFPEVKSIISFGYNYYTENSNSDNNYKISNYILKNYLS